MEAPAKPSPPLTARSTVHKPPDCSALGSPRIFPNTQCVFCVISQRARGLMVGVDLCPGKCCNFRCIYCEVERPARSSQTRVDLEVTSRELQQILSLAFRQNLTRLPGLEAVPAEWLQLKEVALAGDGEPTLCPNFSEVVREVVHARAQGNYPFFKIVLVTNGTGLHLPEVERGLSWFTSRDEIWIKLDAGSQAYLHKINRTRIKLQRILDNIVHVGRHRPVVIQTLLPRFHGAEPPESEIAAYVGQLRYLLDLGTQIAQVQVFSVHKPSAVNGCGHLPLRTLSQIGRRIHEATGLTVDVF